MNEIITNEQVEACYAALHAANCSGAENRYMLADHASALAYAYAVQQAAARGLCVEGN